MKYGASFLIFSAGFAALIATGSLQAQALAKLAHRFMFEGNTVDAAGGLLGVRMTGSTGIFEPPVFEAVVPPGAEGPAQSLRVGVHRDAKKSGLTLPAELVQGIAQCGSLALFVRVNSAPRNPTFVMNAGPLEERGFSIRMKEPGTMDLRVGGPDNTVSFAPFEAPLGRWMHIVLVWQKTPEGLLLAVSANGTPVTRRLFPQGNMAGDKLTVGGFSHYPPENSLKAQLDGNIYDLQFYNGALSPSEIAALAAKPGTTR